MTHRPVSNTRLLRYAASRLLGINGLVVERLRGLFAKTLYPHPFVQSSPPRGRTLRYAGARLLGAIGSSATPPPHPFVLSSPRSGRIEGLAASVRNPILRYAAARLLRTNGIGKDSLRRLGSLPAAPPPHPFVLSSPRSGRIEGLAPSVRNPILRYAAARLLRTNGIGKDSLRRLGSLPAAPPPHPFVLSSPRSGRIEGLAPSVRNLILRYAAAWLLRTNGIGKDSLRRLGSLPAAPPPHPFVLSSPRSGRIEGLAPMAAALRFAP